MVIALFPAVTEELFFRGVIQKLFNNWTGNIHIAIIITGILFSFAHFQFYGFVPRMFLGIVMGYLLYWTNNIWVPIFAHFANNAIAVIGYFIFYKSGNTGFNPDDIGTSLASPFLYVSLVMFVLTCLYFVQRKRKAAL
jgi:membrane protease YdiL (CAAX protease family)